MNRVVTWPLITYLGLGSFVGLALCRVVNRLLFGGNEQFDQTPVGKALILALAVVWAGTVIVLVPVRVFCDRPRVRAMRRRVLSGEVNPEAMGTLQRHLFYANYGSLPKWMLMPFVAVAVTLVSILLLGLTAFLVLYVLEHVFRI